jgi:hypothetical protein
MALPKQVIPISLYKGIDTKSDNKNSLPGELLVLENGIFTNPGKIRKRPGYDALPRTAVGGNIASGKGLSSYNEELVLFTGREVLGFSVTEQSWFNRGYDFSLKSHARPIVNNNNQQKNPESCVDFGLEIYVWEDSSGGVRYSLIDKNNKSILVADQQVDFFGFRPKVVSWMGQFVILYSLKNVIYGRSIDPAAPLVISNSWVFISDLNVDGPQFDVVVNPTDGYIYIGYSRMVEDGYGINSSAIAASSGFFVAHQVFGAIQDATSAVNIFIDPDGNIWLLTGGDGEVWVAGIIKDDETVVNSGFPINISGGLCNRLMGYVNANSGNVLVFYEMNKGDNFGYGNIVYKAIVSANSFIFSNAIFKRGVGLYSKSFAHGNDYFFCLTLESPLQSTYYLVNEAGSIVDRSNVNNGGGNKNDSNDGIPCGVCTNTVNPSADLYSIPFQIKTTIDSNGGVTFLPTGINVDDFDFGATNVFGNAFAGNNLNVVGGVFKNYDGINYTENNFFYYPEGIFADSSVIQFAITNVGTPVSVEVVNFEFIPAYRIAPNSYFTLNSVSANYYVWFRKDGVGTDPTPFSGGVGVVIDINSTDTARDVALAVAAGLPTGDFTSTVDLASTVQIVNNFTGVVTAPTLGNTAFGNIDPGLYLYSVIYAWTDNNGQVQRSTTSVPIQVNMTITGSISIIVPTLRLTEKNNVRVEIYRTEGTDDGSTDYFRVTPLTPVFSDPTVDYMSFIDTMSDSVLIGNQLLYTVGGIVDNASAPSSSMVAQYKNRLFIGGLEDANLLWFSKYVFEGDSVQFSELFTLKVNPAGGAITGLGVLADKLIIFKETQIYGMVGNGPDDTGLNSDYDSGVTLIAGDVGCTDSNSIVIMPNGIMFRSAKGIYLLDQNLNTTYIASAVEAYNGLQVTSAILHPNNNQIRFTTNGEMLVYDYFSNVWGVNTNLEATGATFVGDTYYLLRSDGVVYQENENIFTDNGQAIKLRLTTGWITLGGLNQKTSGIQGFERVYRVLFLGSYYGPHTLQASFAYDYNDTPGYFMKVDATTLIGNNEVWGSDGYWGELGTVWGGSFVPYQWRCRVKKQKCEAIKITVEDIQSDSFNEGFDISNIALEIGVKDGAFKLPAKNTFGNG